jgi:hypothetical protein
MDSIPSKEKKKKEGNTKKLRKLGEMDASDSHL